MTFECTDFFKALTIPDSDDRRREACEEVACGRGCIGEKHERALISQVQRWRVLRTSFLPVAVTAALPSEMTSSDAFSVCRSSGRSSARFVLDCRREMEADRGDKR